MFSIGAQENKLSFSLVQRPGKGPYDFGRFGVSIVSGLIGSSADCYFNRADFEALLTALTNIDYNLAGEHKFLPIEDQLNFDLAIDKFGRLKCGGELFEQAGGWGNSLKFEIGFDQTALKPLIRDVNKFIQSFDQ